MKVTLNKTALTGDALTFATALEAALPDFPESITQEKLNEQIASVIKTTFKDMFGDDGKLNVSFLQDVQTIKGELDDSKETSMKGILKKQGEQITDLLNKVNTAVQEVGGWAEFKKEFEKEETKKELAKIRTNKSGSIAFVIKAGELVGKVAAVTTTTSSITDSVGATAAQRLGDGDIFTMQRGTPWILNFVTVGNTTASALIWYDETQKEGDFAITAEGAVKPLVQYKFERKSDVSKKAAGYTVITEEFDMDYPRLVSTIKDLMRIDCRLAMNSAILTNMVTNASAYAYNGLDADIPDPDDYAAIGAAIAQLESLRYNPNVLVLNPADAWRMRLQKGADGHYVMPPFTWNGQTYEFGQVLVDPDVALGHFFIGDGSVYKVLLRGDIIIRIGFIDQQFIENEYSMVVEQFYYDYITSARKAGLIYGAFDTIKADIAA